MKPETGARWKLGLFIVVGLVLLVAGLFFISKQKNLFVSVFQLKTVFTNVSGLKIGNNVRFGGIVVGTVEGIQLITDTSVLVNLSIKSEVRKFIKRDASASIGSDGLMGSKIIVIVPGTVGQKQLANDDVINTARQVSMDEIMHKLKVTSDNAALITGDLAVVMNSVREGKGTIGMLLMDSVFAENLDAAIVNVRQGAGGFKQNMDAASHNFLLRGFLKRKERAKERERLKAIEIAEDKDKNKKK